jgi:DNA-binding MarR family transcriptional regulator
VSEAAWLDPDEMAAWRAFLHSGIRVLERLDAELQATHGLTLADYEVLSTLSEADDDKMRMTELSAVVLVSKSRLSYRVDRLEARGLVKRAATGSDRRAIYAVLDPAGRKLLEQAAPTHVDGVRRHLIDLLTPAQRRGLTHSLHRALASLEPPRRSGLPKVPPDAK